MPVIWSETGETGHTVVDEDLTELLRLLVGSALCRVDSVDVVLHVANG